LRSSCLRLVVICFRQVRRLSRCMPRYFTSSACGSCSLFNWTGGHVSLLRVKVTCTDLVSFDFILHVFNHDWMAFRCNCSLCVASSGFSWTVSMAVSSAKVAVVLLARVGRPLLLDSVNLYSSHDRCN